MQPEDTFFDQVDSARSSGPADLTGLDRLIDENSRAFTEFFRALNDKFAQLERAAELRDERLRSDLKSFVEVQRDHEERIKLLEARP